MTIIITCPGCMRMPTITAPQVLKSGVTVECPSCGRTIRIDLVICRLEPKPAHDGLVVQLAS